MDDDTRVTLEDENGEEVDYDAIDVFRFEDRDYCVLVPVDEEDEETMMLIFRLEEDGDTLTPIDEAEAERVIAYYDGLV